MSHSGQGSWSRAAALAIGVSLIVAGCGGGGGSNVQPTPPVPPPAGQSGPPTSIHGDYAVTFDNETRTWTQGVGGDGQLIKSGTGTLILSGANTYSGGTTVGGGTLEVMPGGSLGSGGARVGIYTHLYYPGIVLRVDGGVSLTNHILIGMEGTLDNAGVLGGTVEVAIEGDECDPMVAECPKVHNHDGGTIRANDHAVQMNSLGNVTNDSGGLIEGSNAGVWLAAGSVTNDGTDSIIRSANGSAIAIEHGRGTVVNTGGATISSGGTAIRLIYGGSVTNGLGSIIETRDTIPGGCGGASYCSIYTESDLLGGLDLINQGTILGSVLMAPTAINSATLGAGSLIQGDLAMGTAQGSFLTLNGDAGTVQRYGDAVTGVTTFAGQLFKEGGGTWIIGSNDLDGVARAEVRGGTLQIGDGGTSGQVGSNTSGYHAAITIQVASGARLVFNRSDDVVYWGYLAPLDSGRDASVVQMGTGDLMFPDLRMIGELALVVERGSVTLGDGSFQNDYVRPLSVTNNGTLTFDNDGQVYLLGAISGSGSLIKRGPGLLSLDGANTYAGDTTVAGGALRTMQVLPGNVAVNPGTVLQGVTYSGPPPGLPGTAGNLSNGGRVEVGSGDAHIGGNYTNARTGTLAVSLGSKLDVAGTATLSGGTLEVTGVDSGYVGNSHTEVLTAAGGVTGTFDQLVKGSGVVFTATTVNYDTNSVWLDSTGLDVTTAAAGAGVGYSPVSMGSAVRVQSAFELLDRQIAGGNHADISGAFLRAAGQFQQAPTLLAAQASLRSLSGELHAASAAMTFDAIDASSAALSDRFDNLLDKDAGLGIWTDNLLLSGGMTRTGFEGVDFQLDGWLVGNDRSIGSTGVAGFAFGQSRGQQRLNRGFDRDSSRNTEMMLYAGWLDGNGYMMGRVGFGLSRQDVSRQLLLGYDTQGVGTRYDGRYSAVYAESGMHFGRPGSHLTPYIDVQYARVDRNGFAEQGAGGFGLRGSAQAQDRWQAGLGVRAGQHWELGHGRAVEVNARAQWQRTLGSHGDMFDASFVGLEQWQPLLGIGLSRHSSVFGVGLNATLSPRAALNFSYDREKGQYDTAQALSARLNLAF